MITTIQIPAHANISQPMTTKNLELDNDHWQSISQASSRRTDGETTSQTTNGTPYSNQMREISLETRHNEGKRSETKRNGLCGHPLFPNAPERVVALANPVRYDMFQLCHTTGCYLSCLQGKRGAKGTRHSQLLSILVGAPSR